MYAILYRVVLSVFLKVSVGVDVSPPTLLVQQFRHGDKPLRI